MSLAAELSLAFTKSFRLQAERLVGGNFMSNGGVTQLLKASITRKPAQAKAMALWALIAPEVRVDDSTGSSGVCWGGALRLWQPPIFRRRRSLLRASYGRQPLGYADAVCAEHPSGRRAAFRRNKIFGEKQRAPHGEYDCYSGAFSAPVAAPRSRPVDCPPNPTAPTARADGRESGAAVAAAQQEGQKERCSRF